MDKIMDIPENFFVSEEYVLRSYSVGEICQEYYESPGASTDYDLTGQVVWPGAKTLSEFLYNNVDYISGKDVLEVGSGSGFCGLIASNFAKSVVLSDGNEIVMSLLSRNLQFSRGNTTACLVDWNDCNSSEVLLRSNNLPTKFSIIIGADVVFWNSSIIPLFKCIDHFLDTNGQFLMCYTKRAENTYKDLLRLSEESGFNCEVLYNQENTYIFCYTRSIST